MLCLSSHPFLFYKLTYRRLASERDYLQLLVNHSSPNLKPMASTLITISWLVFPATLLILIFLYEYNRNDVVLLPANNLLPAANDLKLDAAAVPPVPLKKPSSYFSSSANATIAKIKNPHTIANKIKVCLSLALCEIKLNACVILFIYMSFNVTIAILDIISTAFD